MQERRGKIFISQMLMFLKDVWLESGIYQHLLELSLEDKHHQHTLSTDIGKQPHLHVKRSDSALPTTILGAASSTKHYICFFRLPSKKHFIAPTQYVSNGFFPCVVWRYIYICIKEVFKNRKTEGLSNRNLKLKTFIGKFYIRRKSNVIAHQKKTKSSLIRKDNVKVHVALVQNWKPLFLFRLGGCFSTNF